MESLCCVWGIISFVRKQSVNDKITNYSSNLYKLLRKNSIIITLEMWVRQISFLLCNYYNAILILHIKNKFITNCTEYSLFKHIILFYYLNILYIYIL